MTGNRVLFFARVPDRRLLDLQEFYRSDIELLEELGYDVRVEHRIIRALLQDADLLYAWWWTWSLPVVAAWRLRGRPFVVTGATDFHVPVVPRHKKLVKNALTRRLCTRLADHNLTISQHEFADIQRVAPQRSSVLYPGVDTEFFVPGRRSQAPSAVTIGWIHPVSIRRKGIDLAIAATALIRESIPDYRLKVIGRITPEGRKCLTAARSHTSFAGVDICGEVSREEKRAALASAWLYLQPSLYEGFGLAVVEAMACGTPPVCSSAGSLPEVAGDAGRILKHRSVRELADTAVDLIRSDETRERLQTEARLRAQELSKSRRSDGLREIFDRLQVSR